MLPTIEVDHDVILEVRLPFTLGWANVQRGALITYESPIVPGRKVCKRVVGLPGDIVCVDPTGKLAPSTEHVVVPRGHVWVAGDNAALSRDSRHHGPLPLTLVGGYVWMRVRIRTLSNTPSEVLIHS
jgi:inner membrane protease subunit 1